MKVEEAIDQLEVGDEVWVRGVVDVVYQGLHPSINIREVGWFSKNTEISLTEPQVDKVEVPDFVAEWYKNNKHKLERAIIDVTCSMEKGEFPYNLPFEDWFIDPENHPIETLIRMKDGYTVKPKRWVVRNTDGDTCYLKRFRIGEDCIDGESSGWVGERSWAFTFDDKSKAEAVATLIDGSVEEA